MKKARQREACRADQGIFATGALKATSNVEQPLGTRSFRVAPPKVQSGTHAEMRIEL